MSTETYEVLYNDCYGGFDFPKTFIEQVFIAHPPHTSVGEELFHQREQMNVIPKAQEPDPSWDDYYEILDSKPFIPEYTRMTLKHYTKNQDGTWFSYRPRISESSNYIYSERTGKYTYLDTTRWEYSWRCSPEVIQMAKNAGLIDTNHGTALLRVAKIPVGYDFDIQEYDGMESVGKLFPYQTVIRELLKKVKDPEHTIENPLTQKLLDGSLNPSLI